MVESGQGVDCSLASRHILGEDDLHTIKDMLVVPLGEERSQRVQEMAIQHVEIVDRAPVVKLSE